MRMPIRNPLELGFAGVVAGLTFVLDASLLRICRALLRQLVLALQCRPAYLRCGRRNRVRY